MKVTLSVHDVRQIIGCHPAVEEYIEYCERVGVDGRPWFSLPGRYKVEVVRDDFIDWLSEYSEELFEESVQVVSAAGIVLDTEWTRGMLLGPASSQLGGWQNLPEEK